MSEFGHSYSWGSGVMIDAWGAGPFVITVAGRAFRFEDSDRFGPLLVLRNGAEARHQPPEKSPFWRAYSLWRKQGRRLADDGMTCVWDHVPIAHLIVRHMSGRNYQIVGGDYNEGGGYVVEHCAVRARGMVCKRCDRLPAPPEDR